MIGQRVGRYRVVSWLGNGSRGVVYGAQHLLLGRDVAVKVLRSDLALRPDTVQRFCDEVKALCRVSHPGVAEVLDFGFTAPGAPYVAMERIGGETLRARLSRAGPLRPAEALRVAAQTAWALAALHAQGIVHCDVRAERVWLAPPPAGTGDEAARVCVGGWRHAQLPSRPGAGAPHAAAEIWALGALLYEMLTGVRPALAGGSACGVAAPARPRALNVRVGPELEALVLFLLRTAPADRPASMLDVARLLNEGRRPRPPAADTQTTTIQRRLPPARDPSRSLYLHSIR
jgi:serine/threonine protein kinase